MPTGEIASCSACFSEMISDLTRPPAHTARRFSEWLSLADQTYSHQRISRLCSFHKANNYTGLQSESITLFECLSRYFEYTYTVFSSFPIQVYNQIPEFAVHLSSPIHEIQ